MTTVKDLRKLLSEEEARWSREDEKYLGKFEDQQILSWIPSRGYTLSRVEPEYGFGGFLVIPLDREGKDIL